MGGRVTVRGFVRPTMPTAGGTGEADRRRAAAGPTPREPGSYRRRVVFDPLQKAHAGRSSHVARRTSHVARPTTHDPRRRSGHQACIHQPRPRTGAGPDSGHPTHTSWTCCLKLLYRCRFREGRAGRVAGSAIFEFFWTSNWLHCNGQRLFLDTGTRVGRRICMDRRYVPRGHGS